MKYRYFFSVLLLLSLAIASYCETRSNFDAGMEAFNKAKYTEASKEFKFALDQYPNDIGYRFYYALSLYYEGTLDKARIEFQKVVKYNKDSPWGKAASSYVRNIDIGIYAPQPEKDIKGSIVLSIDNDDNIAYTPFLVADGYDNRVSTQLSVTYQPTVYSYKPISFSLNAFKSSYEKNTLYNETGIIGDVSLNVPFFWGTFTTLTYGSRRSNQEQAPYYLNDYFEGGITFKVFQGDQAWTTIYTGGSNTLYDNPSYEAYDSRDSVFGIRQNLSSVIYLQYDDRISNTDDPDYANSSDEYTIAALVPIPYMHKLSISQKYINKRFTNIDSIGFIRRHDTAYIYDFIFSRDITRELSLSIRYTQTTYSSNLGKTMTALSYSSYIEHILSLLISYKF